MAKRVRFFPSIALVLTLAPTLAWAAGAPPDKATKEQSQAAQKTFQSADELFDAKKFDEAITQFRASWDIVASPNSRLMIARCLRELGRLDEAYPEYLATIEDAKTAASSDDKYNETKRAAEEELRQLKGRIGLVEIKFQGGTPSKVMVGPKAYDAGSLAKPIVVAPGTISVVATTDDGREVRKEAKAEAGQTASVELDLTPVGSQPPPVAPPVAPPPKDEPEPSGNANLRPFAYIAGGVGAAGMVAFTVFGLMNNSKFSSLEDECKDGHCPADRQSDIDAGKRYQTFANIGLVVGVLGIGTGVTLFLLSEDSSEKKAAKRPVLRIGPRSVAVEGRF